MCYSLLWRVSKFDGVGNGTYSGQGAGIIGLATGRSGNTNAPQQCPTCLDGLSTTSGHDVDIGANAAQGLAGLCLLVPNRSTTATATWWPALRQCMSAACAAVSAVSGARSFTEKVGSCALAAKPQRSVHSAMAPATRNWASARRLGMVFIAQQCQRCRPHLPGSAC